MSSPRSGVPARASMTHSSLFEACSYAYPKLEVDNEAYVARCQFQPSAGWNDLFQSSRIHTRRWCTPEENTRTLAEQAVRTLLGQHARALSEVDVIVVASGTTMPMAHPSDPENRAYADISPLIARQLGRDDALCLDIKACYCAGFVRGLQVVDGLLSNANYRKALLIATEQGSRFATAASNRSSFCAIVSDAAGAVLLARAPLDAKRGILDYVGYTDVEKLSWVGIGSDAQSMIMLGSRAAEATAEMLFGCGNELLLRNQLRPMDIDWFIPIQTHGGLVDSVRERLGFAPEQLLWVADRYGFSGSASIPACLAEQLANGRVKPGQRVLSVAVGAGMNCGGALYTC
jgi:3-oxoacyl-[acyl-carrier-protein] synthase III